MIRRLVFYFVLTVSLLVGFRVSAVSRTVSGTTAKTPVVTIVDQGNRSKAPLPSYAGSARILQYALVFFDIVGIILLSVGLIQLSASRRRKIKVSAAKKLITTGAVILFVMLVSHLATIYATRVLL